MNQVSVIVVNPAYLAEVAQDEADKIDTTDLTPLTSGSGPIVNALASEDGEAAEDDVEDGNDDGIEGLIKVMQEALVNMEELEEWLRDIASPLSRGASIQQPPADPGINVWDSGRAWEREYHLHPDASRDEINICFYNQFWYMLQMMQKRVDKPTWNKEDKDLVNGLNNILVIYFRINKRIEKVLRDQDHELDK